RHAIADDELRLLSLGNPQLGLREELGVRVVLDERVGDGRKRESERADREGPQLVPGERAFGYVIPEVRLPARGGEERLRLVGGQQDAEVLSLRGIELQQLDVHDDLGELLVVRLDDPLGDRYR